MKRTWKDTIERADDLVLRQHGFWWVALRVMVFILALFGWFFGGTVGLILLSKWVDITIIKYFPLATTLVIIIVLMYMLVSGKGRDEL